MRLTYKSYIAVMILLLTLTGCHEEMNESAQLRLSICLPDQNQGVSDRWRMPGDPGTSEQFELPKYAYIFVLKNEGGGASSIWRREELQLAPGDWTRTRYYGLNSERGDSIFKCNKDIQILLNGERLTGRVYAICSNMKLTFNTAFNSVSSTAEVLNWKFSSSPDSIQKNLQNIYSTPYNYVRDGRYYCSFDCSAGTVCNLDLLMYHVASKVDLQWYVSPEKRINRADPSEAVRLTYMEVRRLFNGDAYCFKPLRNEVATLPATGYDIPDIVTPSDEGLWWEGRRYFYTIPYTVTGAPGYFPLQMLMGTNGTKESAGYQLTLNQPIDTSEIFVPWLRGRFTITAPLAATSETKIAE